MMEEREGWLEKGEKTLSHSSLSDKSREAPGVPPREVCLDGMRRSTHVAIALFCSRENEYIFTLGTEKSIFGQSQLLPLAAAFIWVPPDNFLKSWDSVLTTDAGAWAMGMDALDTGSDGKLGCPRGTRRDFPEHDWPYAPTFEGLEIFTNQNKDT